MTQSSKSFTVEDPSSSRSDRGCAERAPGDADRHVPLFRGDATFCPRAGSVPGSITLEPSNYPGWFLHHRGSQLWVDRADGSDQFLADSSFRVRAPLVR